MSAKTRSISIGQYRHFATLQSYTPSFDSNNQELPSTDPNAWTNTLQFWGLIEPLSGRELELAQQLVATVSHRLSTRWQGTANPVDPTQRIVYQGINYNIGSVVNVDLRNKKLVLLLTQVVTGSAI